jgi:hypothetical protein
MKQTYKIDIRHQVRSCRRNLYYVYMSAFGVALVYLIFQGVFNSWTIFLIGTSVFWLTVLMTTPFHIQYLLENWDTRLSVDKERQTVTIEDKSGVFTYDFQEVRTERHLVGHHKPGMIKSYKPVPFDYYGYVKIKTKDRKVFYITSLMTDPFDFPIPINETKYGFPFISKNEQTIDEKRKEIEFNREKKIEKYIERFSKLSNETLLEKVNDSKRYEVEAIEAAKYLIRERQKITTANN